jgi:hypothetical protein
VTGVTATDGQCAAPPDPNVYEPVKVRGFTLSPSPDLRPIRLLAATAVVMGLIASLRFSWGANLVGRLGDTDDAMRLVIVRDLLAGRGWYDQCIGRLAPPTGTSMHWSRLLDGALAGVDRGFALFLSASQSELAMRFFWPLAWIFPALTAALLVARSLGARAAVLITAVLLADPYLYSEFTPGRIDHHNVQITMAMLTLAGAVALNRRVQWAIAGGIASAVGLAVGLEALAFHAIIGASYGLALVSDRSHAPRALAYGGMLAVMTAAFFLLQTPPARWSLSFCDALALNLTLAMVIAGAGLAITALLASRTSASMRLAMLALAGAAATGVCLGLHPACIHGPFADVDPAVRRLWLDRVKETLPIGAVYPINPQGAIVAALMSLLGLTAGAFLIARGWRDFRIGVLTLASCLAVAVWLGLHAWRMQDYVFWMGSPALGAAASWITARRLKGLMVPSAVAAFVASPIPLGAALAWATGLGHRGVPAAASNETSDACILGSSYEALARLPHGSILAPVDLGPYILAFTQDAALTAPYHRLSREILTAHYALDAPPGADRPRIRALKADYIVDCPAYPSMETTPDSLIARLREGHTPAWLTTLSKPGDVLRIYRVAGP